MREGFHEVLSRPWVAVILLAASVFLMLVIAPETVLLPVIGRREFGGDTTYATSLALFAAGGVVGGLLALRWHPRRPGLVGAVGWLPFTAVPIVLAFPQAPWLFYVAYFAAGAGFEPFNIYWQTALQRDIRPTSWPGSRRWTGWPACPCCRSGMALTGPTSAAGETVLLFSAALNVVMTVGVLFVPGVRGARLRAQDPARDPVGTRWRLRIGSGSGGPGGMTVMGEPETADQGRGRPDDGQRPAVAGHPVAEPGRPAADGARVDTTYIAETGPPTCPARSDTVSAASPTSEPPSSRATAHAPTPVRTRAAGSAARARAATATAP